jgi:hypothetical protein
MLMAGQDEKIITALVKIMKAVEDHKHEVIIDETDLGTEYTFDGGSQPTLDDLLKRWNVDAVGQALRQGVRQLGELFIPLATRQEVEGIIEKVAKRSPNFHTAHAIMNHMFDSLTSRDGFKFDA